MKSLLIINIFVLLCVANIVSSLVSNTTVGDVNNDIKVKKNRRNNKSRVSRSTSSSSGEKSARDDDDASESNAKESLQMTFESDSDDDTREKRKAPKSSLERKGWRKWHRKCTQCPEAKMKWRDPNIQWICGAYQRARRSFKSTCMMYYRNCQDGTMFVKISDHRCPNDTRKNPRPYGQHFFYDYKVALSDDSSNSKMEDSSESETDSD